MQTCSAKTFLKKAVSAMIAVSTILSLGACGQSSKYTLADIKLTGTEISWSCPEDKYSKLLDTYGSKLCNGTMVVATDKDIVYLYCEDAVEKDGVSRVSQNTVFDIASVSKTFTAVCILQLAEKGSLSLEDTIEKYFPKYEAGKKITIYELLHMSSGIPDYLNDPDPFWGVEGEDVVNKLLSDILNDRIADEDLLEALNKAPLSFEPGSKFSYSNTDYRLLAFIIEQVSGMKYCDYVQKNIFDICGMKMTTSMAVGDLTYVPVNYYDMAEYGFTDQDGYPVCPNNTRGDGGIHSCLTDMVAFDRALFSGKLLNEKSMELLLKEENGYCCGLSKDRNGYSHSGTSLTCSANNKIIESEDYGYVYVIRLERTGIEQLADDDSVDPMVGTNYTKGIFNDGVYYNDYAELKVNIPKEFSKFSDSELTATSKMFLMSCSDEKDRTLETARKYDSFFYDGNGVVIEFSFLNTKLAAPDELDYAEEDYLDDYADLLTRMGNEDEDGWTLIRKNTDKILLNGKEYVRLGVELDYHGKSDQYYYIRKLDDTLFCVILISGVSDKALKDYENLFK